MTPHYSALHVCTITGLWLGIVYLIYNAARMWAEEKRKRLIR